VAAAVATATADTATATAAVFPPKTNPTIAVVVVVDTRQCACIYMFHHARESHSYTAEITRNSDRMTCTRYTIHDNTYICIYTAQW
jgi:hypothetical protein